MARAERKRVLKEKTGETLWAELENEIEHHYADQEEYTCHKEDMDTARWKYIWNGIEVYLPSMHEESHNVKAVRWTNAMRVDSSFTDSINLPQPSLFVTDIFEICVDGSVGNEAGAPSFESKFLYKTDKDIPSTIKAGRENKMLTVRVQKPFKYDPNTRHYFSAKIRIGSKWITEPSTLKDGEFWFHAEQLSAFFIFASSKVDTFIVEPTGTLHLAGVDERIELDFEKQTVTNRTPMMMKVWPTNEGKVEEVIRRSDEQRITAITDTIFLEHKVPKLHKEVNITMPLHGDSEIKEGEILYLLSFTQDSSEIEYERLKSSQFSVSKGKVKVTKAVTSGFGNGIVKTRAESIRSHEVLELTNQGYLCKFLYFKLPGGTETSFQLWVECVRKEEVENTRRRNEQQSMVEFPYTSSDDTPVYDQENIRITIRGSVKIRGCKRTGKPTPVNMKFLAVSETTHARIPLVKYQMIDGDYFADVDISFTRARGRKPIKSQVDPWGKIMQSNKISSASFRHRKLRQQSTFSENASSPEPLNRFLRHLVEMKKLWSPTSVSIRLDLSKSGTTTGKTRPRGYPALAHRNNPEASEWFKECFKEKSLQALALAVPPNQAKILARELSIENTVIERLYEENNKNIAEFTVNMLLYWKKATDPDNRFECLLEALEELRLQGIVSVLREKHTENTLMRSSDFEK